MSQVDVGTTRSGRIRRALPFGSQFSPKQVDLAEVLEIANRNPGNADAFTEDVRARFFSAHAGGDLHQQREMAKNVRLALRDYGLLGENDALTDVGRDLLGRRANLEDLYSAFARHILLRLRGLEFVNTVRDMRAAGEQITLPLLHKRLAERGLYFSSTGTHASSLRGWLSMVGIMASGRDYVVDEQRLSQVIGLDTAAADKIEELTVEQQAFLEALANLPQDAYLGYIRASDVVDYAEALYGIEFPKKAIVSQVLTPLEAAGFIEARKTTAGRGAKSTEIRPTDRLGRDYITPVVEALAASAGPAVRRVTRLSLRQILQDLAAADRHVKGLGLEALAVFLFRLLDMEFVRWRLRGRDTGGAEVDVIVEGARLVFSRWQIQCKNTGRVVLDDVAKEVGLAFSLKSNVIVVVSTGTITRDATEYARTIMQDSNLNVVLLDGTHLRQLIDRPTKIVDFLNEQARQTMALKRLPGNA